MNFGELIIKNPKQVLSILPDLATLFRETNPEYCRIIGEWLAEGENRGTEKFHYISIYGKKTKNIHLKIGRTYIDTRNQSWDNIKIPITFDCDSYLTCGKPEEERIYPCRSSWYYCQTLDKWYCGMHYNFSIR